MDKKIAKDDIIECNNYGAHGDEYVRAVMFCCSCESYLCIKCDQEKHNNADSTTSLDTSKTIEMHIRIPISTLNEEEERMIEKHIDDDTNVKLKLNETNSTTTSNTTNLTSQKEIKKEIKRENKKKSTNRNSISLIDDDLLVGEADPFDSETEQLTNTIHEHLNVDDNKNNKEMEIDQLDPIVTLEKKESNNNNNYNNNYNYNNNETKDEKKKKRDSKDENNLKGLKETEITFNNIYENQKNNSCALEDGEEDNEIDPAVAFMEHRDTVEASNIVQGVVEGVIELGTGIADGVSGVIADPVKGARSEGVKGFFKGVGRGLSGVAIKPVKGSAGMVIRVAEGVRNTPNAIFTPQHQHVDVVKEKEASHLLDGLYQGTLGLGKGIFDGVTGIVIEPIKGAQEKGGVGFVQGLGKGLLGVICKPVSGAMDFVSKPIEGLANTPKTIIDAIDERKLRKELLRQQKQQQQDEKNNNSPKNGRNVKTNNNNEATDNNLVDVEDNYDDESTKVLKEKTSPSMGSVKGSPLSTPPRSPSILSRQSNNHSQKEFNKKWLDENKSLSKNSISSIDFKE